MISTTSLFVIGALIFLFLYTTCKDTHDYCDITLIITGIIVVCFILGIHFTNFTNTENFQAQINCTAGQRGLVYGNVIPLPTDPTINRQNQVVYSYDIVNFFVSDTSRKISLIGNQNLLSTSDQPSVNLNKLRIFLPSIKNQSVLTPICYGDQVKLIFSYGRDVDYFVSNNLFLGMTQTDSNNVFQLINANDPTNKNAVKSGENIFIKAYTETADPTFLKETPVTQISTTNQQADATLFTIVLSSECNPNWNFETDSSTSLITVNNANKLLLQATQNINQKLADFQKNKAITQTNVQTTCTNKLNEIIKERTLLQSSIDQIAKK